MKKGLVTALLIFVTCLLAGLAILNYVLTDHIGPVITVDSSMVQPYSSDQGEDVLKSYATAIDVKDGDVSSSIEIENIYVTSDLTQAKVVYVAKDYSNNLSKLDYVFEYNPSEEEIENAKNSMEEETTDSSAEASSSTETTKQESTTAKAGAPVLTLTKTEDTISTGTTFSISKYISDITDDKDNIDVLSRRVVVSGTYSTSKSGDYTLDIYCTDSDKNESNHVSFTLHVK